VDRSGQSHPRMNLVGRDPKSTIKNAGPGSEEDPAILNTNQKKKKLLACCWVHHNTQSMNGWLSIVGNVSIANTAFFSLLQFQNSEP
jgi:hypothetical protein